MFISYETYVKFKDAPILHDEDEWGSKYRTYGEMWSGEGYTIGEKVPTSTAEHIKMIRSRTGMTQATFADLWGIPRRTLEDWERGARKPPAYVINMLSALTAPGEQSHYLAFDK